MGGGSPGFLPLPPGADSRPQTGRGRSVPAYVAATVAGMDDMLLFRIKREHGLITTRAALAAGLTPLDIQHLVRSGRWVVVRRGVFVERETWDAADVWSDRPRLRSRAVDLRLGHARAFSHDSAALEHGLPLIGAPEFVHITRTDVTGSRRRHGVVQHGAPFDASTVTSVDGLPVLPLARTAVDIAREHGYAAGLVAIDGALRLGATHAELRGVRDVMTRWPGITSAEAAIADADAGAETAGETLSRILVTALGVGPARTQFPVLLEDGTTAWLDLIVGCHGFEFDGKIKVQSPASGGVAARAAEEVVWKGQKRDRLVRALGLGISHVIWEDVTSGTSAAHHRLLQEYRQTEARFGTRLSPALEEYAVRMRPHRERRLRANRNVRRLD